MHATESFVIQNKGAGTYPVVMGNSGGGVNSGRPWIMGGRYQLSGSATWGGGNAELLMLGPDGATYIPIVAPFNNAGTEVDLEIGKLSANGAKNVDLPPGIYEIVITTTTNANVALTRVPVSN